MNKNIFSASLVAILIIGAIVAIFLYGNMTKRPAYSEIEVKTGNIQEILSLNGKVQPQDSVNLGFEIGGKVVKLNHEVGDFVKAGTILANSNTATLQAEYRQAQALARSAQNDLDQYQQLYKMQKAKLDSLKKSSTANSSDKKAQKNQIEASEAQAHSQEDKVAAAFANVDVVKTQIAKTVIVAPIDGTVSKQEVKSGETAQADEPIITLISQNSFKVEAFASEIDVKNIQAGDMAEISFDDWPDKKYGARIIEIDPAESVVNDISNYKVTLNFISNISDLRSGTEANISVISQNKNNVLQVPEDTVFEEAGKKYIYVSKNGLKEKAEIQTGIYGSNDMVEIISGLRAGDKILELKK